MYPPHGNNSSTTIRHQNHIDREHLRKDIRHICSYSTYPKIRNVSFMTGVVLTVWKKRQCVVKNETQNWSDWRITAFLNIPRRKTKTPQASNSHGVLQSCQRRKPFTRRRTWSYAVFQIIRQVGCIRELALPYVRIRVFELEELFLLFPLTHLWVVQDMIQKIWGQLTLDEN